MIWRHTIATSNLIGWHNNVNQSNLTMVLFAKYVEVFDRSIRLKISPPQRDGSTVARWSMSIYVLHI